MQNTNSKLTATTTTKNVTIYACNFVAYCNGTGWNTEAGKAVVVTEIQVSKLRGCNTTVCVTHDSDWEIYNDSGFEEAISNAVGFEVCFTEQGMQEDNTASMEKM